MLSPKLAAGAASAALVVLTSLMLAQPAGAAATSAILQVRSSAQPGGPGGPCRYGACAPIAVAADCGGRLGHLNAHSYTRDNAPLLKYDVPTSQQIGTVPANARIILYYRDDINSTPTTAFWAVKYNNLCGYVRGNHILWNKTW